MLLVAGELRIDKSSRQSAQLGQEALLSSRPLLAEQKYQCRLKPHGRFQLELKTHFPVPERGGARYSLDLYIFSPSQLKLTADSYGLKQFFEDLTSYTRYSSPRIPLPKLVDPQCAVSPLTRIREHLDRITLDKDICPPELFYELKTLANTYRVEWRAERYLLAAQIASGSSTNNRQSAARRSGAPPLHFSSPRLKRHFDGHIPCHLIRIAPPQRYSQGSTSDLADLATRC